MITPIYAALLTLFFIGLSARVIYLRGKYKVSLGTTEQPELLRAIRVHANFSEYVPLAIILLFILEQLNTSSSIIHALGITLLTSRVIHCYGVSQVQENLRLRIISMVLNFLVLISCAILLIVK